MTARTVTLADLASFETVPRYLRDGSVNPEFGCVFWSEGANGATRYDFDTAGWSHCLTTADGSHEGHVEKQGRSFRIAGPSNDQVLAAISATGDFRPFHEAFKATGGKLADGWAYQVWLGARWRAFEARHGRTPDQPAAADRDAFLAFVTERAAAELVAA